MSSFSKVIRRNLEEVVTKFLLPINLEMRFQIEFNSHQTIRYLKVKPFV